MHSKLLSTGLLILATLGLICFSIAGFGVLLNRHEGLSGASYGLLGLVSLISLGGTLSLVFLRNTNAPRRIIMKKQVSYVVACVLLPLVVFSAFASLIDHVAYKDVFCDYSYSIKATPSDAANTVGSESQNFVSEPAIDQHCSSFAFHANALNEVPTSIVFILFGALALYGLTSASIIFNLKKTK